jgi:hypothetical protein
MRQIISIIFVLLFFALPHGVSQERGSSQNEKNDEIQPLAPSDKAAVKQAIVDEMYANQLQGFGFDVGKQISDSDYQLKAYFKPSLNRNGAGFVIYKLMPYGEVLRLFSVRSDELAVLYGKLRDRFPPTQPSYLTVYADDDELCKMKRDWQKEYFTVELKPSAERVAEALARERKRNSP